MKGGIVLNLSQRKCSTISPRLHFALTYCMYKLLRKLLDRCFVVSGTIPSRARQLQSKDNYIILPFRFGICFESFLNSRW